MRTKATIATAVLMALLLGWQHFNGGVPAHHLLADPSLPSLSNWWGLLALPLLAWYLLGRIERRRAGDPGSASRIKGAFAGSLLFGVTLGLLFSTGQEAAIEYLVQSLVVVALFYPIYRAEYVLGFVLGMSWAFGPVLPIIPACLFALVGAIIHLGVRLVYARMLLLRR
jgi:hypothetical protein